jgi:DNA modification methylase/transposase-like protein
MTKRIIHHKSAVVAQALADYQKHEMTTGQIAAKHGVSTASLTVWAKKAKMPLRGRGRLRQEYPSTRQLEIIKLAGKQKYREVGAALGRHKQSIHRTVKHWDDLFAPQIKCGDCLHVMRGLSRATVDMIFADIPFNVGMKYRTYKDRRPDYREWCAEWIAEGFRVLKPTGSFYLMTITRHLEWQMPLMAQHGVFVNLISWRNVTSAASPRCFRQEYQPILFYGKTAEYKFHPYAEPEKPRFERWGKHKTPPKDQRKDRWDDIKPVYAGSIRHREAIIKPGTNQKAHPTQMPLGLPKRAMLFSTDVGDTVLDPFNGSGTTGEAAKLLCRRYVGIEQDPKYVELTQERLAKVRLGRDL